MDKRNLSTLAAAFAAVLIASSTNAQSFESLSESEAVGYCATFYLAKKEHAGKDDLNGEIAAEATGFLAAASLVADKPAEELASDLSQAAGMMKNFFRLAGLSSDAQTMLDQSESFCRSIAPNYDATNELFQ